MASLTVVIFSASSSGISNSKASSKAMTNSTISRESAPRSSTNDALLSTWLSSTPSCSTMICFTFCSTAMIPPGGYGADAMILASFTELPQPDGTVLSAQNGSYTRKSCPVHPYSAINPLDDTGTFPDSTVSIPLMSTEFLQDLRYAARTLTRNRTFSVVAVLSLALGIGATTSVFSVVDRILFRSLPFADSSRLVSIGIQAPVLPSDFVLGAGYLELRRNLPANLQA